MSIIIVTVLSNSGFAPLGGNSDPDAAGLVHSQKYLFICLTDVIFPEYQCHFRYKGKFLFKTDIQHVMGIIFFLVKKRYSEVNSGYNHEFEWGTHISMLGTGIGKKDTDYCL